MVSILAPSAAKNAAASNASCAVDFVAGVSPPSTSSAVLPGAAGELLERLQCVLAGLPNSCFEAAPRDGSHPGYTPAQRVLAALSTAVQYGLLGLVCGGAGQAVTNALAGGVATGVGPAQLPGVLPVALLWSNYMAVSASVRYQLVAALEGAAERTSFVGANPLALTAISAVVRLCNNIYGAGLFVDMMRESGISP